MMCRTLGVSRSGFYQWLSQPLSDRAIEDQRLLELIRASYTASGGVYGEPREFLDLREAGETCGQSSRAHHAGQQNQGASGLQGAAAHRRPVIDRRAQSLAARVDG
jgi:putative transposase